MAAARAPPGMAAALTPTQVPTAPRQGRLEAKASTPTPALKAPLLGQWAEGA